MREWKALWNNKTVRTALIGIIALLLLLAVWFVFYRSPTTTYEQSKLESRVTTMLEKLDGVDTVSVMITEAEGWPVGAIVFFEGEDSILSRIRILDITSSLLQLDKKYIQVYPA